MVKDGRPEFFRKLDVDKHTMKLLYWFREIKTQMLNEKDNEDNSGKIYKE